MHFKMYLTLPPHRKMTTHYSKKTTTVIFCQSLAQKKDGYDLFLSPASGPSFIEPAMANESDATEQA